ncbi:hypothetical protein [Streptomyces sp. NPDC017529]|uniref:hypothetical protein n=1 Tax=Streptomyces sp. NPDC017529 TaxID=3365000 RepID=UPI0037B68C82
MQDVLACLAAAAAATVARDHGDSEKYVLAHLPFRGAADILGRIRSGMPLARRGAVFQMALADFELEVLWEVLGSLQRARDADEDAAEVHDYATRCFMPPCGVDDVVVGMERILAVLSLNIPAVRPVATTLLLGASATAPSVWRATTCSRHGGPPA